jgi:hypothetical protein
MPDFVRPINELGGIARAKPETVYVIEFIMTQIFRPSTGIKSSTNFILTSPAYPNANLHIIIHGFAFWKFAKPVHEHHLQVLPERKPGLVPSTGT